MERDNLAVAETEIAMPVAEAAEEIMPEEAEAEAANAAAAPGETGALLLVDDNKIFLNRLARSFQNRGFEVTVAASVKEAIELLAELQPDYAVVDLKLQDGNGMDVIKELRQSSPDCRAIILTGYGNIASAVNAVKLGAVDYLSKPTDADAIYAALISRGDGKAEPLENPMSVDRVRWEHIQRVYEMCDRNISETARRLSMHRRTLQRILAKHAPK